MFGGPLQSFTWDERKLIRCTYCSNHGNSIYAKKNEKQDFRLSLATVVGHSGIANK